MSKLQKEDRAALEARGRLDAANFIATKKYKGVMENPKGGPNSEYRAVRDWHHKERAYDVNRQLAASKEYDKALKKTKKRGVIKKDKKRPGTGLHPTNR